MTQSISAADANRNFSALLRSVHDGASFIITSHGKPVARIVPASHHDVTATARHLLLERLRTQDVIEIGPWSRDELYED
ncbi:MAG: type II toxin-antitoxin system prevent-host-death family antitoxin [Alphaproteobacteria bacterium]|nr:type II toxin-antitoxin system prevent-host-death family antitoxin [Alphaproteobacteria bacterium]